MPGAFPSSDGQAATQTEMALGRHIAQAPEMQQIDRNAIHRILFQDVSARVVPEAVMGAVTRSELGDVASVVAEATASVAEDLGTPIEIVSDLTEDALERVSEAFERTASELGTDRSASIATSEGVWEESSLAGSQRLMQNMQELMTPPPADRALLMEEAETFRKQMRNRFRTNARTGNSIDPDPRNSCALEDEVGCRWRARCQPDTDEAGNFLCKDSTRWEPKWEWENRKIYGLWQEMNKPPLYRSWKKVYDPTEDASAIKRVREAKGKGKPQ